MRSRAGGLFLAMLSVGLAFVIVLSAGFWLSRQNPAFANSTVFGTIAAFAIAFVAAGIARLLGIPIRLGKRRTVRSVPGPRVHVPVSPEFRAASAQQQNDYASDPSKTITCTHLQPIERAMRAAGIKVVPIAQITVEASCRIHRPSLLQRFTPPDFVSYREYFMADRAPEDNPVAHVRCGQCESRIDVYHPALCNLNSTWFPGPPPSLTPVANHLLPDHIDVTAIACSPSGRYAAIAAGTYGTPQSFSIWDADRAKPLVNLPAHGVIRGIAWSADEKILITGRGVLWHGGQGSPGASLFVWDARSGAELLRFGSDLFGIRGIALSPDAHFLLASGMLGETASEGSTLDLWDVATGRLVTRFARVESNGAPALPVFHGVAFTPDGSLALAGCNWYSMPPDRRRKGNVEVPPWWNRGIRAWSLSTGQEVDFVSQPAPVTTLSVSIDGTRLFFAGGRFGMWDLTKRWLLWDKQNSFGPTAASPDCGLIARGRGYRVDNHGPYEDTGVELFDGSNGVLLSIGHHQTAVEVISMTQNGTCLVAGGEQGEVRFWNWRVPKDQ
jgi:WD40 repeat protein